MNNRRRLYGGKGRGLFSKYKYVAGARNQVIVSNDGVNFTKLYEFQSNILIYSIFNIQNQAVLTIMSITDGGITSAETGMITDDLKYVKILSEEIAVSYFKNYLFTRLTGYYNNKLISFANLATYEIKTPDLTSITRSSLLNVGDYYITSYHLKLIEVPSKNAIVLGTDNESQSPSYGCLVSYYPFTTITAIPHTNSNQTLIASGGGFDIKGTELEQYTTGDVLSGIINDNRRQIYAFNITKDEQSSFKVPSWTSNSFIAYFNGKIILAASSTLEIIVTPYNQYSNIIDITPSNYRESAAGILAIGFNQINNHGIYRNVKVLGNKLFIFHEPTSRGGTYRYSYVATNNINSASDLTTIDYSITCIDYNGK